jgi:hypothetical protein
MIRGPQQKIYLRIFCGVFGVAAFLKGLIPVLSGNYSYENWFGGLVFAPFAIAVGVVMVLGAVFNWRGVWDSPSRNTKYH